MIKSHLEFVKLANNIHNNKYEYPEKYVNTTTKIKIICPYHGDFFKLKQAHIDKKEGCPNCSFENMRLPHNKFVENANNIHNNKYEYPEKYINDSTKIRIKCVTHGEFLQTPNNHLSGGCGCPLCKGGVLLTNKEFNEKANLKHNNKYIYPELYINSSSKIRITCNEHGDFQQTPHMHLQGQGCPKCGQVYKRTYNELVRDMNIIHNNKYTYPIQGIKNTKTRININCSIHGEFKQSIDSHLRGSGCPFCKKSKGENIIKTFLINNNISYEQEYKFKGCFHKRLLPFDFYLPFYNMCIEFDGIQHFKPIEFFGGIQSYNELVKRDRIKNDYCHNNNIGLLRIKYNDDIIEKIKNNL